VWLADRIGERNVFRPGTLAASANYIRSAFAAQGYAVREQAYEAAGQRCLNLEVERRGERWPEETLLVGAHYDSVRGSPGANDNGSGVAALLELAGFLQSHEPGRSVRLVAFVNEEPPFFYRGDMGSMLYARAARRRGDRIRLMISLETIGYYDDRPDSQHYPPLFSLFYPDRGNFIAFVANLSSRRIMRRAVAAFRSHSTFPLEHVATLGAVPGVSWSDHLAFWREGYRAFMVTDTAPYRYPYYHSAQDTPEQIDYDALAQVTAGVGAMLMELADSSSL
jgi:Zn-dependent M28 family amino/carboxypeptidase